MIRGIASSSLVAGCTSMPQIRSTAAHLVHGICAIENRDKHKDLGGAWRYGSTMPEGVR